MLSTGAHEGTVTDVVVQWEMRLAVHTWGLALSKSFKDERIISLAIQGRTMTLRIHRVVLLIDSIVLRLTWLTASLPLSLQSLRLPRLPIAPGFSFLLESGSTKGENPDHDSVFGVW